MDENLIKTIFARRSIRKYMRKPVSKKALNTMLEAAMAAPSASNRKPWHFIIITKRNTLDKLARAHPYAKMLLEAPLCIAICGDTTLSPRYWVQDCSAATENLLLAAVAQGLGAVWLGVFPREERVNPIRRILNVPENIIPLNLISIGYPAEEKEQRTQYDKQRIHHDQW